MRLRGNKQNNSGFTLIELLTVVAVLGLLSSITMVSFRGATQKAQIARGKSFSASLQNILGIECAGAWNFDEGAGTSAVDASGNGANGQLTGGTWRSGDDCISRNCLEFNGSSYVNIPSGFNVNCDEITIDLFIKDLGTSTAWVDYANFWAGTNRITLEYYSNTVYPIVRIGASNYDAPSIPITTGFNHYAVVLSKSGDYRQSFKNGVQVRKTAGWPGGIAVNLARIGQGSIAVIDNVRVYGKALTTAQIRANYIAGLENLFTRGLITKEEYQSRLSEIQPEYAFNEQ